MNAAATLRQAQADGLTISLTGRGTVKLKGPQSAIDRWTPAIRECKAGLLALLQAAGAAPWGADDWQHFFGERAAIAEYDGAIPRPQAEQQAWKCCIAEWLCQNPVTSDPGSCARCGRGDLPGRGVMPYGDADHGHTHLHSECWPAWHAQRRQDAIAALGSMGLLEGMQSQ